MDPSAPESFKHNSVTLNTGRKYHYVDQLPENYDPNNNITLLLVHGFPDLWYGYVGVEWVSSPLTNKRTGMAGDTRFAHGFKQVTASLRLICLDTAKRTSPWRSWIIP